MLASPRPSRSLAHRRALGAAHRRQPGVHRQGLSNLVAASSPAMRRAARSTGAGSTTRRRATPLSAVFASAFLAPSSVRRALAPTCRRPWLASSSWSPGGSSTSTTSGDLRAAAPSGHPGGSPSSLRCSCSSSSHHAGVILSLVFYLNGTSGRWCARWCRTATTRRPPRGRPGAAAVLAAEDREVHGSLFFGRSTTSSSSCRRSTGRPRRSTCWWWRTASTFATSPAPRC